MSFIVTNKFFYRLISQLYLGVVAFFITVGNLARFVALPTSFGAANLAEVLLFPISLAYFFAVVLRRRILFAKFAFFLILINSLSLLIGLFKWGIDVSAITYNVRFSLLIISAFCTGYSASIVYKDDISKLSQHVVATYAIGAIFALALYLTFPESALLWATLSDIGIEFSGDPHVGRLVSLYFDPNFYGTIIVLPIFLASVANKSPQFLSGALFLLCLSLTASRSGISTFVIMLAYFSIFYLLKVARKSTINIKHAKFFFLSIFLAIGAFLIFSQYALSVVERFTSASTDTSANARVDSFGIGISFIADQPLLGFGYNFSYESIKRIRDLGLDSSLQLIIISYGLVIFTIMLFSFFIWSINMFRSLRAQHFSELKNFFRLVFVYFCCCMLWAGNFNQIFFYPYWILPVVALFSYIEMRKLSFVHDNKNNVGIQAKGSNT